MGLFKKRSADPDDMARLRSEIAAMSARLDASDHDKAELGGRVADLAVILEQPLPTPPAEPSEPLVVQTDHDLLRARVQRLTEQLESAIEAGEEVGTEGDTAQLDDLRTRVDQLTERLDTPLAPPPTDPPPPTIDSSQIDSLRDQIQRMSERLDGVDARITSISTELANQISEMSGDLESLGANEPVTDEIVEGLRDAQTRLASEQARYQIAFRQDLADLVERLRRA